jgi:alkylation response protein AidB-like acyl-CoA dehydrogenase
MTTGLERSLPALSDAHPAALTAEILEQIAASAAALDNGEQDTGCNVKLLSRAGLTGLGAPLNSDQELPSMAVVIGELAAVCLSTAFSVWAHRMTIEYLTVAGTPWSHAAASELLTGEVLGVTGMASAFKDAAGCGSLDLTAEPVKGGYALSGTLRWASNLQPDSIMVTAARSSSGEKIVVALPVSTKGVSIGGHFELLALGSTASSYLTLKDAVITDDQILSRDIESFLDTVRPTFLVLQSAMCAGLARRSLNEIGPNLTGVNSVFEPEVDMLAAKLAGVEATVAASADSVGGAARPGKRELLTMRLGAAEVVSAAAALEIRAAGGKGYARRTDASRRYREAAFIPVQSPSEAQLRWELSNCQ